MSCDVLVEVCCGSVDDVIQAEVGGAGRVELNSSLFQGGLTPSAGAIIESKERISIPLMVMVRPRAGGFCYTEAEIAVMERDVEIGVEHGADGIVFGVLGEDGRIDVKRCGELLKRVGCGEAVFHRAFDVVPDPFEALEQLIDLGFKRILTSGQQRSVPEGMELIAELIERADGRIEILPGGGIRPYNVRMVVERTGADQVHLGAFRSQTDFSCKNNPNIRFGGALYPAEDRYDLVDSGVISSLCRILGDKEG